jgi:hypothetical protein
MSAAAKPFVYYDSLKSGDIYAMVAYALMSAALIAMLFLAPPELSQIALIVYVIPFQLGIYFGLYISLRNFRSYRVWFGFAVLHTVLFFFLRNNTSLKMEKGNPALPLINTIFLILLFQLLRYISLKTQKREFSAPSRSGNTDVFTKQKVSGIDYLIFIIYMAAWFGSFMFALS